ncbi:MAG: hypothetical protein ACRENC_15475 [Gemmatimonadaceae bacterium]
MLGDDGVLVQRVRDTLVARAWREPLQLSIELADYFPELHAHHPSVDWSDPRHRISITYRAVQHAPIAALVFLERARDDAITPLSETVALSRLVRQSSTVLLSDILAAPHLAALRELVMRVPRFQLEHTERQLHHVHETLLGLAS